MAVSSTAQVFISEIHYDNTGTDVDEGVEITGPAGTDLTGWSIVAYNGNGGASYNTVSLSGVIPDEGSGFGAVFFAISGLQNGSPDGLALVNGSGVVLEFLSYEGSFTATNGPASGTGSTDVGVSEPGSDPVGSSIQLTDAGWIVSSGSNSYGTINAGLTLGGPPTPTMTATPNSYTGLDYLVGSGPSASQSGTISASNLDPLSTVTGVGSGSIASFEFSVDNVNWTAAFPGPLPGAALNTSPVTVYVRLVAGLPVGTYNATITVTNTGGSSNSADEVITFEGTVTAPLPDIIINEFQADPSNAAGNVGDANGDGTANSSDDEFVEFYNNEATAVDMSNWTLSDAAGLKHTFPVGTIVPAGGFITVFGGGTPTGISGVVQTASSGQLQLNNGGDIITLENATSQVVTSLDYNSFGNAGNNQSLGRDPDLTGGFVLHSNIVALGRLFSPGELNVTPPSSCNISIDNAVPSACDPGTNTYSVDVTVSWSSAPATGTIDINGTSFAFSTSPQTFTLSGLSPSGAAEDVTAVFSADGTCTTTSVGAYTSPAPCLAPIPACTELFFSEYIEGSSSNKCLEIYNPTSSDIDLGAGNYAIGVYGNGSATPNGGATVPLSGVIPAYGTFVICNSGATAAFTALADVVGGSLNAVTLYNGNDAVSLEKNGVFVDVIGQIGNDPGSAWTGGAVSTVNQTLVRMSAVQAGDNIDSDAFDPSTEWMALPQDDASNLGWHNNACAPFVWTGLTSTDYHTGSNWTKGTVPTDTDHAWIPSAPVGGVFPLASQDVELTDLTVRSSASLDIAPTFGLTFEETANVDGTLTLQSSASGTAWMDDFTSPTATYNGNITVQTYVSTGSGLGQRYFGSPVVAGTVSGLDNTYATGYSLGPVEPLPTCDPDSLAVGSPYSNLFLWNEDDPFTLSCVQEGWEAIAASTVLTPGRGYSGWMNDGSIISITGAPNTGDVSFTTTGTTGVLAGASGWHVLSNPFTSPLDVTSVNTLSNFSSVQIYNGASGPFSGTFLPIQLTGPLAVMQGFVAEHSGGSPVFNALEASRSTGNEVWQRPDFGHMLNLTLLGNGVGDQTFVYFKHDATDNFDNAGDCKKRQSDAGYPTLFTMNNGERMSLNGLSSDNMNRSIDLGLMPGITGNFTLSFDGLNSFPATTLIFLEDKLTGEMLSVREVNEYTFDADVNDSEDRFVLHFTSPVELVVTEASCEGSDAMITMDFGQNLIAGNAIKWNYSVRNSSNIINAAIDQNGVVVIANLDKGNYTIELQQGSYSTSIDVNVEGAERVVADFENPVAVEEGTWVNLANLSTGAVNYEWTVEGQQYSTQDLNHQFITPGQHEIRLASSNDDCEEVKTKFIEVFAKSTGITDAHELANANVYTNDNIIVIDLNGVENIDDYTAFIFNLLGQEVDVVEITSSITQVEVNDGGKYYFVQLVQGKTQKVFKVLVK